MTRSAERTSSGLPTDVLDVNGRHGDLANDTYDDVPTWAPAVYEPFRRTVGDRLFPCFFGTSGVMNRQVKYVFIESKTCPRQMARLAAALEDYLPRSRQLGPYTSLITLFKPEAEDGDIEKSRAACWEVLQRLHQLDREPWPPHLPRDPDDPRWSFAFAGEPVFVVCTAPAYAARRSRQSDALALLFQPRWVFDAVTEASRSRIRSRLRDYDMQAPSPAIGAYGDENNREWRQTFIPDRNDDPEPVRCPFHHKDLAGTSASQRDRRVAPDVGVGPTASSPAHDPSPTQRTAINLRRSHRSTIESMTTRNEATDQTPNSTRSSSGDTRGPEKCPFHRGPTTRDAAPGEAAQVVNGPPVPLGAAIHALLPAAGSVEVQRDPAGHEHPDHVHAEDETLLIVEGGMTFNVDGRTIRCDAGDRLHLPAMTKHSSIAGSSGALYIIAVDFVDGAAA